MLTIFTPTYNRANIISKLYQSLKEQTSLDFEWIVVDDESTDETEQLFDSFDEVGQGIRYCKQNHGGKHRAINKAVQYAKGDFFFIVDSDDYLLPNAVELINNWTKKLTDDGSLCCGVSGLRIHENGEVCGGNLKYPAGEYVEVSNIERERYNLQGDKAEVYSTSILKKYPFPEFDNEFFVTEAVVWDKIALDGYKLRWYNTPIYVCEYLEDGLTKTGANDRSGHLKNPKGYAKFVSLQTEIKGIDNTIDMFIDFNKIAVADGMDWHERQEALEYGPLRFISYYFYSLVVRIKRKVLKIIGVRK